MTKAFLISFLLLITFVSSGQEIIEYELTLSVSFLPSGGGQLEVYKKNKNKQTHTWSQNFRWNKKAKITRLKNDPYIQNF